MPTMPDPPPPAGTTRSGGAGNRPGPDRATPDATGAGAEREPWSGFVDTGGVRLYCRAAGAGEPVLLLHGFPDFGYGWRRLVPLIQDRCRAVFPDLRGYNLSDRPAVVDDYAPDRLIGDVAALIRHFGRGRPVRLVGNDWGGVVAWLLAEADPSLIEAMVILNAPHPAVLAAALRDDPVQRAAAAYIQVLRNSGSEATLAARDYAALSGALAEPDRRGPMTAADSAAYRQAWDRPGALKAMLDWYRAAPFLDPAASPSRPDRPIPVRTLLLWGAEDAALLPGLADRHREFCRDLEIRLLPGIGHWPQVEAPDLVAAAVLAFFGL